MTERELLVHHEMTIDFPFAGSNPGPTSFTQLEPGLWRVEFHDHIEFEILSATLEVRHDRP